MEWYDLRTGKQALKRQHHTATPVQDEGGILPARLLARLAQQAYMVQQTDDGWLYNRAHERVFWVDERYRPYVLYSEADGIILGPLSFSTDPEEMPPEILLVHCNANNETESDEDLPEMQVSRSSAAPVAV